MQWCALSPTIFNVVVDAVVCHLVEEIVYRSGGQVGFVQESRHQNDLFYADYDMVESSDPG